MFITTTVNFCFTNSSYSSFVNVDFPDAEPPAMPMIYDFIKSELLIIVLIYNSYSCYHILRHK